MSTDLKQKLGLKRGAVALQPHDPAWARAAEECIVLLKNALGEAASELRHVGSTAIRGIHAKPIIDIAVAVDNFEAVTARIPALEAAGIIFRGSDHPGQLLLVMGDFAADTRSHHIHVVLRGSTAWENYVNFTDYLNSHPQAAAEYDGLKLRLAAQYPEDRGAYTAGKQRLIDELLCRARLWRAEQ